jgi:hypothetical protein
VVVQKIGHPTQRLRIVHSKGDRLVSTALLILSGGILTWYAISSFESWYTGLFFLVIFSVFLITTFFVYRTEICITPTSVFERFLSSREFDLPPGVTIDREGSAVIVRKSSIGFEYKIPGYLDDGDRLEGALKELLDR